jgi:DNA-binding IclR family transcriptional regulator
LTIGLRVATKDQIHYDEPNERKHMIGGRGNIHTAYSAPIVSKAMKVLKMIVTSTRNPGISEIASKLSLAKSTTHGILAALEESGWVLRDPVTRKYTCGHAVKDIAQRAIVRIPLVDKARPYLEKLASDLDEDVFLGICTGHQLLILDQMESSRELKITARPGTRLPLFAGGAGKVFLAYFETSVVAKLLESRPIPHYTSKSIVDPAAYLEELARVRDAGVSLDTGEYLNNVWAVAVPLFYGRKNRRRMVAGFWVVGIDSSLTPQRMQRAERLGRATGQSISRALNNYGYDEAP